jgi:small subunit ribosomal protein S19e
MPTIYDIKPQELIKKTAEAIKSEVPTPTWANFVKTGHGKENRPLQSNWYQLRAASILRKVYKNGPIGTSKLRKNYTTKKNRGHRPEITTQASGKIIRSILQQLEKAGYIKQIEKGVHKGREITPKGKSLLDKLSNPKTK